MEKTNTKLRKLILSSIMVALSVMLTRFLPDIGTNVRLNLGYIPIFYTAILISPVYGGAVGMTSDIIGYFINPKGSGGFFPGFAVTYFLMGIITGVLYRLFKKQSAAAVFISAFIATVFATILNCWWLQILYSIPFLTNLSLKAIPAIVLWVVHSLITYLLISFTKKAKLY